MANTYKAVSVVGEHYFGAGVRELDLSVAEERDALTDGHLVLVPRKYQVLTDNYEAGKKDALVDLALPKENEAALIQGGHLQRVDAKQADDKPATRAADKKEK